MRIHKLYLQCYADAANYLLEYWNTLYRSLFSHYQYIYVARERPFYAAIIDTIGLDNTDIVDSNNSFTLLPWIRLLQWISLNEHQNNTHTHTYIHTHIYTHIYTQRRRKKRNNNKANRGGTKAPILNNNS